MFLEHIVIHYVKTLYIWTLTFFDQDISKVKLKCVYIVLTLDG